MFRPGSNVTVPPMVSVFDANVGWVDESIADTTPSSGGGVNAAPNNYAMYFPIVLPASCTVRRVWWANGADVSAGAEIDVGVYADDGDAKPGVRLVHGAAVQSGTNTVQFVDVTDTIIGPGLYWIAISSDLLGTIFRTEPNMSNTVAAPALWYFEIHANPLPAVATPEQGGALYLYLCGFSTVASP